MLEGKTVFDRQDEIVIKIQELNQLILGLESGNVNLDQPLVEGLISETNPLYQVLKFITLRTALLFLVANGASTTIRDAVLGIVNLSGIAGVNNEDVLEAVNKIEVSNPVIVGY